MTVYATISHFKVPVYSHTFTVRGRGEFPMDMLRRDQAYPVDTASAMAMVRPEPGSDADLRKRSVTLRAENANRFWEPTVRRWASMDWEVVPVQD